MDPSKIPKVKKIQETKTHFLICDAHIFVILLEQTAASAEEKIMEVPTSVSYTHLRAHET